MHKRNSGCCAESLNTGVFLPFENTDELSNLIKAPQDNNVALVPHGGSIGLVNSTDSYIVEAIVSLERMNNILRIDPALGIAIIEGSVTLELLDTALELQGTVIGVDFPAGCSCIISGMVAMEAGRIRVLKYGVMRQSALGLGSLWLMVVHLDPMSSLVKSNADDDLKRMSIGSEGASGWPTRIVLNCPLGNAAQALGGWPARHQVCVSLRPPRCTPCALSMWPEFKSTAYSALYTRLRLPFFIRPIRA